MSSSRLEKKVWIENMEDPCNECLVKVVCSPVSQVSCSLKLNYVVGYLSKRGIVVEKKGFEEALLVEAIERLRRLRE